MLILLYILVYLCVILFIAFSLFIIYLNLYWKDYIWDEIYAKYIDEND